MPLEEKRSELEKLNENLFALLKLRKELIREIQSLKSGSSYDFKRENELFLSQAESLKAFSPYELYIYSLIIEEHCAQEGESYPRWSQQEHLNENIALPYGGTNPLLLALYDKRGYDLLSLKDEYLSLFKAL